MIRLSALVLFLIITALPAWAAELLAADKASKRSSSGDIVLIDIRRPGEWNASGVAASAHLNSMHEKGFLQRLQKITGGRKDKPVALICARGNRSTWMAAELEKQGYTNVINVREGMFGSQFGPGWLKRGLPVRAAN